MHERHVAARGHHDAAGTGQLDPVFGGQLAGDPFAQDREAGDRLVLVRRRGAQGGLDGVESGGRRAVVHDALAE